MKYQRYCRKVNYHETDKMSIVYHGNYIKFFDEARLDWMEQAGLPYVEVEQDGLIIPVVDVYAKYYKSLKFNDEFEVEVSMKSFSGVKIEYEYKLYIKATGELSAEGASCHCFLTGADEFPINVKKRYPEIYEKLRDAN